MTAARTEQGLQFTSKTTAQVNARRSRLVAATELPIRPDLRRQSLQSEAKSFITLTNAQLRLDVAPSLGGGITRFDWRHESALVPIFRQYHEPSPDTDPNQLACYPLLPYSHRIGNGHFQFSGCAIDVPRNRADEPCTAG